MKHGLLTALLFAGTVCMAGNLLVNGDMKTGKGWSLWGSKPGDAKAQAKILTYVNEGPAGTRVLKFEDTFDKFNPYLIQWVDVTEPAGRYRLSFSLRTAAGKRMTVMVQMMGKDPATGKATQFLGALEKTVSCTGDWQKCELEFSGFKAAAKRLGVAFCPQEKMSDRSQTGSFLLTGVSFEPLPGGKKPFTVVLKPGVNEYTVTPPESGTYWFRAHAVAQVPVGRQHFAVLRWDNDLPMTRRLLAANQTEWTTILDRVVFEKGKPRKLRISFDPESVSVYFVRFSPQNPGRVPPAAAAYRPPFDPPAGHPRVLVNPQYLDWLKKHLETGNNAPVWAKVRQIATAPFRFAPDPDRELQFSQPIVDAMRAKAFYYLVTGDEKVGREAVSLTLGYMTKVSFGNGQDICRKSGESIYSAALVYDWCSPLLTDAEKKLLRDRMLYYAAEMEIDWPPFRQSAAGGHGNEAQVSRDLLAMAIAVWNEDPVPYRYVMYQMLVKFQPFKAYSYRSGRHSQGMSYGKYRGAWDFFAALQFRRTFGRDLLPPEAAEFPYEWHYLRVPDGRFMSEGDSNWVRKIAYAQLDPILPQCAVALFADPELKMELLRGNPKGVIDDPVFFLLTNDPGLKPADRRAELPLTRRYIEPLPGMIVRTGWNFGRNADDAVVSLQGGHTHFRNHQHRDAGAFQIYYRGPLAVDLAQYQNYGVPYDMLLAKPSALHDLMRFVDPASPGETHGKVRVNTGVQRHLETPNVRKFAYPCGETPRAGFGPDAKRPLYDFLETDLGTLFPGRVKEYARTFVFLSQEAPERPGTLLVLDRFSLAKPEVRPIFQLASLTCPEWKSGVLTVKNDAYGKTGVLTLTPLVPGKVAAEMFTGKDAHTFGGVYIPPQDPTRPEASGTRTELTGPGGVFLNALQIHGGEVSPLPVRCTANGRRYDVGIADWLVGLGDVRRTTAEAFKFTVPNDQTKVLLLDLAPGKWRIGGRVFAVTELEGSVFAVFDKGVHEAVPGADGAPEPPPDMPAKSTPPPVRNAVVLDGTVLPGVRIVTTDKGVFLPLAKMARDAAGNPLIPPEKAVIESCRLFIAGYPFALPRDPGPEKWVPAELAAALLGMEAESDELSGSVYLRKRTDRTGILHAAAAKHAEDLRGVLYRRQGAWVTGGRKCPAEIVFAGPRELSGMEFDLVHGDSRRQFLQIDLVAEDGKAETVFDGETDGKSATARITFAPRRARAVRLVMKGNSRNAWNNVAGIRFLPEERR